MSDDLDCGETNAAASVSRCGEAYKITGHKESSTISLWDPVMREERVSVPDKNAAPRPFTVSPSEDLCQIRPGGYV
ncbi:hypothetical protein BDZ89DRAFT_1067108 [Hymenopellis radicata]|nr:hypothetical protein BDZ89DRAFT_1067108 [Hymenopellis radicata]